MLIELARKNGGLLTAEAVVEAARPEESPLHDWFTWDDSEAARQWRLQQARQLIIRVKVEVATGPNETVTVRGWSSLTPDRETDGGGYRETIRVMKSTDMRAQLLINAKAEMDRFVEKYNTLGELAEVITAMRKVRVA